MPIRPLSRLTRPDETKARRYYSRPDGEHHEEHGQGEQ